VLKPKTDTCIFLHGEPEDWRLLLGEDFVNELIRRLKHVAGDLDQVVRYILDNPGVAGIAVRGLVFGGPFREKWRLFAEGGYVDPGARVKWPYIPNEEQLGLRIQISPCFLLASLSREVNYVWRNRASSLFKWVSAVPRSKPLEAFREAFPAWLRDLAHSRGYAWVAWTRWRDRRNRALAEWLYWLDKGKMPHIDAALGRMCETALRTKKSAAEVLHVPS